MRYKNIPLKDVEVGKNFKIWNHEYTVLDGNDKGVFVLEADSVCVMPFREGKTDYKVAPNDFRDSSVRAYLEGTYVENLVRAGAKLSEDIFKMELDFKCTLGQHEYGTAWVYAGLLTLEQYGKYHNIIPRIDTTYWLVTPWKTPIHTLYFSNINSVWYVNSEGSFYGWCDYFTFGVRPTLTLNPSLLVSVECDEEEEDSDNVIARSKNLDIWNEYCEYLIKWAVTHANDEDYIGDYPLSYYDDWDKEDN